MKVIIAVDSVFQLVCALNIAFNEFPKDGIILVLRDHLWNTNIKLKIHENQLIEDVFYTNSEFGNPQKARLWQLASLISSKYAISKLINSEIISYKVAAIISSTSIDYLPPLEKIYRKFNPRLFIVEEGVGEYTRNNRIYGQKSMTKQIKEIIFGRKHVKKISTYRFMIPDYQIGHNLNFVKAPLLSKNDEFKVGLIQIFDGKHDVELIKGCQVIYFEQPFMDEKRVRDDNDFKDNEMYLINQFIGQNKNSIVKRHPRSKVKFSSEIKCMETTMPWEAMLPSIDLEDKILIAVSTTSIVTPKLMLNQEPVVICLHKIFMDSLIQINPGITQNELDRQLDFFIKVKAEYKNPEEFCIPNTMEEAVNFYHQHVKKHTSS